MKILTRYILKEFFQLFLLTLSALVILYILIDIFERVDDLVEHHASYSIIIQYFLLETPYILFQMLPFATLFATILTLSILTRNRETIAISSLGLSPYRISIPIIAASLVISIFALFFNETVLPATNGKFEIMKKVWIKGKSLDVSFKLYKVWLKGREGIYNIRLIDPKHNTLRGLTLFGIKDDSTLFYRIEANTVIWRNGQWIAQDARVTRFGKDEIKTEAYSQYVIHLDEHPDDLKALKATSDTMNFFELNNYISRLEQEGYISQHYKVDLYNKLSIPFASLVMACFGIPFGLKRFKGGIPLGLTLSIILGFSYWILQAISTTLGYGEILPPFIASWLPNITFSALSVYLLLHASGE